MIKCGEVCRMQGELSTWELTPCRVQRVFAEGPARGGAAGEVAFQAEEPQQADEQGL